jgi:ribosomal protein S24E
VRPIASSPTPSRLNRIVPIPDGEREYQPDFDAKERAKDSEPRYRVARESARRLLQLYKLTAPPVDVEAIVRARGLTLAKVEVEGHLSAQLYAEAREIVVNTHQRSIGRQRFSIAHELGHWELAHYLLEELPPDTRGFAGAYEGEGESEGRSPVEIEANVFAAELLMPTAWIHKLPKPLGPDKPDRLAHEYQVSREAMFYQLMRCRMI